MSPPCLRRRWPSLDSRTCPPHARLLFLTKIVQSTGDLAGSTPAYPLQTPDIISGVPPFSFLLALSAGLGLAWAAWQAPEQQARAVVHAGLWASASAFLGGRAAYVAVNWEYYQIHPIEIPQVWLGGFSGAGALVGAALFVLFARAYADALLPLGTTQAIMGWLMGSAYGQSLPWGLPFADEFGNFASRWPVQLIGVTLTLAVFIPLDYTRPRLSPQGLAASLWLLGQAIIFLMLSFMRADPIPAWYGLRLEAWGAMIVAGIAILCLILIGLKGQKGRSDPR